MRGTLRASLATALTLLVFAVISAALLSGTHELTRDRIAASERAAQLKLLAQTLPAGGFDNDLVQTARVLPADPRLGLRLGSQAWTATRHGQPVAVVLEAAAPDGYAGEIRLLVGILADGQVSGVRVTGHRETPGLGDYIERGKSDWIEQFEGKSLVNPPARSWRVRKDGGTFDAVAGATITPRAVIGAVRRSLEYFAAERDKLLGVDVPAPATPDSRSSS